MPCLHNIFVCARVCRLNVWGSAAFNSAKEAGVQHTFMPSSDRTNISVVEQRLKFAFFMACSVFEQIEHIPCSLFAPERALQARILPAFAWHALLLRG